jgi:hypothetical protein
LTSSLSKKKLKKPLDISPKISDNITNDKVIEDTTTSEEAEEESFGVILDDAKIDEGIEEVDEIEEVLTPEEVEEVKKEVQRKINTEVFKRDGWLDDVDTNTKK